MKRYFSIFLLQVCPLPKRRKSRKEDGGGSSVRLGPGRRRKEEGGGGNKQFPDIYDPILPEKKRGKGWIEEEEEEEKEALPSVLYIYFAQEEGTFL